MKKIPHRNTSLDRWGMRSFMDFQSKSLAYVRDADCTLGLVIGSGIGPDMLIKERNGAPWHEITPALNPGKESGSSWLPATLEVTVINSAFRNLPPSQAAHHAKAISPHCVIPCHQDLFSYNCLPDRLLRSNLILHGMEGTFCPLRHGEIRLFSDKKRRAPLGRPQAAITV